MLLFDALKQTKLMAGWYVAGGTTLGKLAIQKIKSQNQIPGFFD